MTEHLIPDPLKVGRKVLAAGHRTTLQTGIYMGAALIVVMIVAYLTAHLDSVKHIFSTPEVFLAQTPFLFLLASLFIFAFGPGVLSLDAFIYWIYCNMKGERKE